MAVELTENLLSTAAGWDVMKRARAHLEQGDVVSSFWEAPLLRGVVRAGGASLRASMVIKNHIDMENLCTCREAREWGKISAHVVAVGLHWLKAQKAEAASAAEPAAAPAPVATRRSAVEESLAAADLDGMSPREAHAFVSELQQRIKRAVSGR